MIRELGQKTMSYSEQDRCLARQVQNGPLHFTPPRPKIISKGNLRAKRTMFSYLKNQIKILTKKINPESPLGFAC